MFIASHRKRKLPKVEDERRLCKRKCLNAEKCIKNYFVNKSMKLNSFPQSKLLNKIQT